MEPKLFDPRNPEPPLPASDYRDVPLPPDRGFYTSVSVWRKLPAETPVASSSGREEGDSEGEDAKMGDLIGAGDGLGTGNDPDTTGNFYSCMRGGFGHRTDSVLRTAATSASHAQSPAPPASAPPCSTSGATDSSTAQDIFNTSLSTQDKMYAGAGCVCCELLALTSCHLLCSTALPLATRAPSAPTKINSLATASSLHHRCPSSAFEVEFARCKARRRDLLLVIPDEWDAARKQAKSCVPCLTSLFPVLKARRTRR